MSRQGWVGGDDRRRLRKCRRHKLWIVAGFCEIQAYASALTNGVVTAATEKVAGTAHYKVLFGDLVAVVQLTYRVDRTAYIYHSSYGEKNWKHFRGSRWQWVFEVMQQFLQSCLEEYRNKFPDLFTTHKGGEDQDFIVLEANKMNAIKKYGEFKNYQDIYNSNTFFIFGVLSNMCQEAKQIEEMNRKIKSKR